MYKVSIPGRVQKTIDQLPPETGRRILAAITALATNPRPPGVIKLTGVPQWRIRIGDYRVLYAIDDAVVLVTVVKVGKRDKVYD